MKNKAIRKSIFIAFVIVISITITNKLAPILFGPEPSEEATAFFVLAAFAVWFIFQVVKFFVGERSAARLEAYERRKALRFKACEEKFSEMQYAAWHQEYLERRGEIC